MFTGRSIVIFLYIYRKFHKTLDRGFNIGREGDTVNFGNVTSVRSDDLSGI